MRSLWLRTAMLALLAASGSAFAADESRDRDGVGSGVAITHEFAKSLFDQMAPLREADGCILSRFDTSRFRIVAGMATAAGKEHAFEFATASAWSGGGRRVGTWRLLLADELDADCVITVAAIERILRDTAAPYGTIGPVAILQLEHTVLAGSFLLLLLGSGALLAREYRAKSVPRGEVLALLAVSLAALALRLGLSPRTFLHEYYHIAETIAAYLAGNNPPTYGNTGPVIYRLVGALLGRTYDVDVIFLTNAVLASLAIPAIALLDLAIFGRWSRALCAAIFLCVLPQHLRFSASEVLFIPAITFAIWSLTLGMLYVRTGFLVDALLCVIALSLAMQSRPELMLFPVVLVALIGLVEPRGWRVFIAWRTLAAFAVLGGLLSSRLLQLGQVLGDGSPPASQLPLWQHYRQSLVLFDDGVTPSLYLVFLAAGAVWALWRRPGLLLWSLLAYGGFTLFSLSLYSNGPYNLRTQLLPMTLLIPLAAGVAPLWLDLWGRRRRWAIGLGAPLLVGLGVAVVVDSRGFIGELRDQQLEWQFLQQQVADLPQTGRLLAAVDIGARNLNAFPGYLLRRNDMNYQTIDVRKAAAGQVDWPAAGDDLLYYQGMYCYFAFDNEPSPAPMSGVCRAVHERYTLEPLSLATLDTTGYSWMQYAPGPYRIGFYRLRSRSG